MTAGQSHFAFDFFCYFFAKANKMLFKLMLLTLMTGETKSQ